MAVGDFTKQEADVVTECIEALWGAIPKKRQLDYIGEFNEALIFVERAKAAAPSEEKE